MYLWKFNENQKTGKIPALFLEQGSINLKRGRSLKSRLIFYSALFLTFLYPWFSRAQQQEELGLRMEVDKRQVEVGESLTVSLEYKQVGNTGGSSFQEPSLPTPERFQINGTSSSTQVTIINQQTAQISTTKLHLEATKSGSETLGPAILIYQDPQGQKRELKSNVVNVTVVEKSGFSFFKKKKEPSPDPNQASPSPASPPPTDEELHGIKPLLDESHNVLKAVLWIVILVLITWFIWRQFNKPIQKGTVPRPLGVDAQLRDSWRKLSNEELSSKDFCLALSALVRECLQYSHGFPAVDFTTEEIFSELKKHKLTNNEMEAAEKCLRTCDRVLYADGNLTGRDNLRSLCSALLPKVTKN